MFTTILWDIDGTVLNFSLAEAHALKTVFQSFGLPRCTDEMVLRYSSVNLHYWELLEEGKLTKPEVLQGRFVEFLGKEGLSVSDLPAFCNCYELLLADKVFFNDDALTLLTRLKEAGIRQYAVTNGTLQVQSIKLKKSGLDQIFDDTFISDVVGFEKPSKYFFNHVLTHIEETNHSQILIVGDSLTSDMRGGNNSGISCCWYNPAHAKNTTNVRIDHEIDNLWSIEKIIPFMNPD